MQLSSISGVMPTIPNWRFGHLQSPLTKIANSAGYSSWSALVKAVRSGICATVDAPDIGGRSIGNAYLFRDACDAENITVIDVEVGNDGQDRLTLQMLAS